MCTTPKVCTIGIICTVCGYVCGSSLYVFERSLNLELEWENQVFFWAILYGGAHACARACLHAGVQFWGVDGVVGR